MQTRQVIRQTARRLAKLIRRHGIDAGGAGRRWDGGGWIAAPEASTLAARGPTRARASDAALDTPSGARIVEAWTAALVGCGWNARSQHPDAGTGRARKADFEALSGPVLIPLARAHPDHDLSEPARPFAYMTPADHARDCLRRAGISTAGLAPETVIKRALSTSDFPMALRDAAGREIRRGYQAAASGARMCARQTPACDFREKRRIMLGEAPTLTKVLESAEFQHGTIDESGKSYKLATYGRIVGISRQALVNNDPGAFTDVGRFGQAAADPESSELVAWIVANPAMSDGTAVFHADHVNLQAIFAAPSTTTLPDARVAMRRQTGLAGRPINVVPRYLLVPPELETTAEQLVAQITAAKTEDVNPFAGLSVVVDPRLTDDEQWYVVADPAQIDGLEYAYLEGSPGPQIETRAGFEVDGVQIKVRLDFGFGWIDRRGWYRVG